MSTTNRDNDEDLFVMKHMMSATTHDTCSNNVWYVYSRASNHMKSYKNWFNEMHVPERLGDRW